MKLSKNENLRCSVLLYSVEHNVVCHLLAIAFAITMRSYALRQLKGNVILAKRNGRVVKIQSHGDDVTCVLRQTLQVVVIESA